MVLIVEDEKVSRMALAALLRSHGYSAQAVGSAEEALQLLDDGYLPDVALVDLDLPGMSGEQFLRRLSRETPSVDALLLTAADEDRVDRLSSISKDRPVLHLRKPIDFKQLLSILHSRSALRHHHQHDRGDWHNRRPCA